MNSFKKSSLVIEGVLENRNGEKMPVVIGTKAWQSGRDDIPPELEPAAKEKVLSALLVLSKQKESIEEVNKEVETKGDLQVFACSPPICWSPASTIIIAFKKEG